MSVTLTFLGAAGTVTGSKYLVEGADKRILVDCGMFQGDRNWNLKNWEEPPVKMEQIDAVLLTHAHIDHSGLLPRYYKLGMRCPIFTTAASAELTKILLADSAHLQQEEAKYRNKKGKSRHNPALALYEPIDAEGVSNFTRSVPYNAAVEILPGVTAEWKHMGHILGAASISLRIGGKSITFSGDIGRYGVPILRDPEGLPLGDLLLMESTYGDKFHPAEPTSHQLSEIINRVAKRGGCVLFPAFAVGRTQHLLFALRELKEQKIIPDVPVIVDSPMASDVTSIYRRYRDEFDQGMLELLRAGKEPFRAGNMSFLRSSDESKKLNQIDQPMIIISASGMLTGGRILHHIKNRISDPRNALVLVGFQPPGGRGDWLRRGATTMTVLGEEVPVRAEIAEISGMSAHADKGELLRWAKSCSGRPGAVAVVHGEPGTATAFAQTLREEMSWPVQVAEYCKTVVV